MSIRPLTERELDTYIGNPWQEMAWHREDGITLQTADNWTVTINCEGSQWFVKVPEIEKNINVPSRLSALGLAAKFAKVR